MIYFKLHAAGLPDAGKLRKMDRPQRQQTVKSPRNLADVKTQVMKPPRNQEDEDI